MRKILLVILILGILLTANSSVSYKLNNISSTYTNHSNDALEKNPIDKISEIRDLEPGDILFHISQYIVIHCLIFKQYNLSNNMYEFIEANSEYGVRRIFYTENKLNNTLIYKKFVRIETANNTQKQNAILFAESQIGKESR